MKLLFESWRKYLSEQQNAGYKIYCDMDGVLVAFHEGAISYMNEKLREAGERQEELSQLTPDKSNEDYVLWKGARKVAEELGGFDSKILPIHIEKESGFKKTRNWMYSLIGGDDSRTEGTPKQDFWASLGWLPEGRKLWGFIKDLNPSILTGPMGPASEVGKEIWCMDNLGSQYEVIITPDKGPWGNPKSILIDDRQKYRDQFESSGGIVIAHDPFNAATTIEKLKEIIG